VEQDPRKRILERRKRFIAAAVISTVATAAATACACLKVPVEPVDAGDAGSDAAKEGSPR
jgi:hypothetical protein